MNAVARPVRVVVVALLAIGVGHMPALAQASAAALSGRLAFVSGESIAVLNLREGTVGTIFSAPEGHSVADPRWSPDGASVAFEGPDGNGWLVNADGSGARAVTDQAVPPASCDEGGCADPGVRVDSLRWSPDGARLSYRVVERLATASVWVESRDGTGGAKVAAAPDTCLFNEGWTTTGLPLVSRCVTAAGTSNATYLATDGHLQPFVAGSQLAYSTDGSRLAFSRHTLTPAGMTVTLLVARADSSGASEVAVDGQEPRWSSAGLIAYQLGGADGWHVRILDPETQRDLDVGLGEVSAWSGDGAWLFYTAFDGSGSTIWRVRADGTGATPVVSGRFADWAPE